MTSLWDRTMLAIRWVCLLLVTLSVLPAQSVGNDHLIFVIPQALNTRQQSTFSSGDCNVTVDPACTERVTSASAFRASDFGGLAQTLARPFNIGIATQLATLPIASPASGVIFKEDPSTGAALPAQQSLGPILTERAETIGKRRFFAAFTRQQFRFDKLEGQDIGNLRTLDPGGVSTRILQGGVRQSTSPTTIGTQIKLGIDQNIAIFTYGLTNRLDVTAALSWVHSQVSARAFDGQIYNTGNPFAGGTCWCAQTWSPQSSANTFASDFGASGFVANGVLGAAGRSSTGIGDTLIRVKGTVLQGSHAALAVGGDLRLPTGEELDFHGSGATGFKPFLALSLHSGSLGPVRVSPHFNLGYQFNGDSRLAGDFFNNEKGDMPDLLSYSAGAGISIGQHFTFMTDILATTLRNSNRLVLATVPGRGQGASPATGMTLAPDLQSYTMTNGAFGFKLKLAGNLLFNTNLLVAFDDNGLRDKLVPLFGLGYTF